ncbi:MAG: YcxB family protein [Erysipelotrichaceae bacterium]
MKTYRFVFTLEKNDYLEYMRNLVSSFKENKKKKIWLVVSIPLLAVLTALYFKQMNYIYKIILGLISLLWIFVIWKKIWNYYLSKKVNDNFLENIGYKKAVEVNVEFFNNEFKINEKNISYQSIQKIRMLTRVIVIFYDEKLAVILPKKIIGSETEIKKFLKFLYLKTQL